MEAINNIQQFKIYVDAVKSGSDDWLFFHKNDTELHGNPENDFYIPILLTTNNDLFEYVQIDMGDEVERVERQEVNPFFMELSFFDNIKQIKILSGDELTSPMISFIRNNRPELSELNISEIKEWFDQIGINELPWNSGTPSEVTIDDIDRLQVSNHRVISKANYFNIDINK